MNKNDMLFYLFTSLTFSLSAIYAFASSPSISQALGKIGLFHAGSFIALVIICLIKS